MGISAKDLAQYIRETVSFDFSNETISSYDQIRRRSGDFFAVEDTHAFFALLSDIIGKDNQLIDIFMDLQVADRGFKYFANAKNRDNPYIAISAFLGDERFEYHKQELDKIYFAINTWLCFFGASEISIIWDVCPICEGKISNSACNSCGKSHNDLMSVMLELQDILENEMQGKELALPRYYKDITPKSHFGYYKEKIDGLRESRIKRLDAENALKEEKALALAAQELKKITAKVKIELAKENPDFDLLLNEINSNSAILDALRYDNRSFKNKVDKLLKEIQKEKEAHIKKNQIIAIKSESEGNFKDFVMIKSRLENEVLLVDSPTSYDDVNLMLELADELYNKVYTTVIKHPDVFTQSEIDVITDYQVSTKPKIVSKIKKAQYDAFLDDSKDILMTIIGDLEKEYERCKNLQDDAHLLWNRFVNDVEKSETFIDCREDKAWDIMYDEQISPLKRRIEALLKAQINAKTKALTELTEPLKSEIKLALPKHKQSEKFKERLTQIQNNPYFKSIYDSAVYKQEIAYLNKAISNLIKKEKDYFRKKWMIIKITSVSAALLFIILYSLFAYIIPKSKINFYFEKNQIGKYDVVGIKNAETENLVIPEYLPHYFLKKDRIIVNIVDNAFLDNHTLKKCVLPASIKRIGSGAFSGCTNLSIVILQSPEPPTVYVDSFEKHKTVFLVPVDNFEAYLQAEDWQIYKDNIFPFYDNNDKVGMVMFDSRGGNIIEPIKDLSLNTLTSSLPTPQRFGYTFDGWYYYDIEGNENKIEGNEAIFAKSTKLFAKWNIGVYSVLFSHNDGSENADIGSVTYGDAWGKLPMPSRNGYIFDGWYLNDTKILESDKVDLGESATLLAKWIPLQYSVSFDSNGGKELPFESSVIFGQSYGNLPTTTRIGYTFGGWKLDGTIVDNNSIVSTSSNHTLVAEWLANAYTVNYDLKGGSVVGDSVFVCRYDEPMNLASPVRAGYSFEYWEHNGVRYNAGDVILNLADTAVELTFEAHWKPNRYTVIYDPNGGMVASESVSCIYDQDVAVLTPVREGYTLLYWASGPLNIGAGEIVNNLTAIDGDEVILQAIWKPNEYTVQYMPMGGTQAILNVDCVYDQPIVLDTPTRVGYFFLHWKLGDNTYIAGETVKNLTALNGGRVELVAIWEPLENSLILDKNIGDGEIVTVGMLSDSTTNIPLNTFVRAGYTFMGWSTVKNGEVEYADGALYSMDTSSVNTLYAVWAANTNMLVLVANNKTEERLEFSLKTDEVIQLPINTFSREGYVFAGWRTPSGVSVEYVDNSMYTVTADSLNILVAVWQPIENTLYFDSNGGEGVEVSQVIASEETKVLLPCSYTREGYRFVGWSTSKNGDVNYLDGSNYTMGILSEVRLYAVWEIVNYDIIYHLDGGENSLENKTSYNILSDDIILNAPKRVGYTFNGWYSDSGKSNLVTIIDTSSLSTLNLYADWKANQNILVFHNGGASGTMTSYKVNTDATITLPACTFVKTGYEFLGWSTILGGEVYYLNGAEYLMGTETEYTLYAVWEKVVYNINYYTNGGTNSVDNPTTYHIESMDITLSTPAREGYTFGGWYTDVTMTTSEIKTIKKGSYGHYDLYARWIEKDNILRFNANGGSGTMSDVVLKTGELLASLPTVIFERPGYNFAGWALTANGNSVYGNGASFEMGNSPLVTLYAVWTDFSYSISYNLDGGINNQQNPVGYKVESDKIIFQSPTKAGYSFEGWYKDSQFKNAITEIPSGSTGNLVIFAKWKPNANKVVFNANGGTGTMSEMIIATDASAILTKNAFTRVGYVFAGWATSSNGNVVYSDNATYTMGPNASYTLYAKWNPNKNTIVFNANGGSGSMSNQYIYSDMSAALNKNTFYRSGYKFAGWATTSSGSILYKDGAVYAMGTSSTYTLYAKWEPNVNTLVFNANGGSGTMGNMSIATDATVALSSNTFTREGYKFVGWATSSGGSAVYSNGGSYKMGTSSSYTIYACWERQSYTITVKRSNTSVKIKVDSVEYDNPDTVTALYNSQIVVTYSSNFGSYSSLTCTVDGTSVSNGYTFTMPASAVTISASSTEASSGGGGSGSCLAEGTLITMADGSRVAIENIRIGDCIKAFDHKTGRLVDREVVFVFFENRKTPALDLVFSNGAIITIVNSTGHGMFDITSGKYVLVTPDNVDLFVGNEFAYFNEKGVLESVELVSYTRYEAAINRYDLATAESLNFIANDFLVCSDLLVNLCNTFSYTDELTYDYEKLQSDVVNYGLYSYSDWERYVTEEEFEDFGGMYFKIAVGKKLITENDIIMLLWFLHCGNV